jgi:hypothetical protein
MKNISYALGMTMAGNFLKSGIKDLDVDAFAKAMKSVYKKEATELSADEAREIIDAYFNKMQAEADSVNKRELIIWKRTRKERVYTPLKVVCNMKYCRKEKETNLRRQTPCAVTTKDVCLMDVYSTVHTNATSLPIFLSIRSYLAGWKHSNSCQ